MSDFVSNWRVGCVIYARRGQGISLSFSLTFQ